MLMAGNQTLVGEVPAIAVYRYQKYDTIKERDKTICCETHQITLYRSFFLFDRKCRNEKGIICWITSSKESLNKEKTDKLGLL